MTIRSKFLLVLTVFGCAVAQAQNQAPTQITTVDGRTYRDVTVLRVEPDGLLVSYQPEPEGVGFAKLKFRNLPDSLRSQYGYDQQAAAAYEAQQAQATAQWHSQMQVDEALRRYRSLAEINWALGGDAVRSYSISLDANGKVTAQGFTGNALPYACWSPFGLWSGLFPQWVGSAEPGTSHQGPGMGGYTKPADGATGP